MKTVLQVLQYGDIDFRFKTDFDPQSNPESLFQIITGVTMAMSTTLWGGNEAAVLAVLRALTLADLSLCVNRKDMIKWLDEESRNLAKAINEARREMEKRGKMITFGPGIAPSGIAN